MSKIIKADLLDRYRQRTFRLLDSLRLKNKEQALQFVKERGFVYFWPIKGIPYPSLWTAVAGNRAVADAHDDPGHVTWGWKDAMLDKRQWYYAKVLRGKATMISLKSVPYFYALSENYGDPENDFLQLYEDGLLSREAKLIYEALLQHGPINTVRLRQVIHMTGKASNSPFDRAMIALQRDFKLLPVSIAEAGAWRYSFIYDLVHRYYPELPAKARSIGRQEAREALMDLYFSSVGAATLSDVRKIFQWSPIDLTRTLENMADSGRIIGGCEIEGLAVEHFVHEILN